MADRNQDVFTSIEVMAPLGVDLASLDYDQLPVRLHITEPREQKSITIHMNATAMLHMLVGLIADLGELTGRAHRETDGRRSTGVN